MIGFWLSLSVPQNVSRVKSEGRPASGVPSAPVHNPIQTPDFGMIIDDEISVVPEWQVCNADSQSSPAHAVNVYQAQTFLLSQSIQRHLFQKESSTTKNDTEGSTVKLEGRKGGGGQTKKPEGGENPVKTATDQLPFFQTGAQSATTEETHFTAVTVARKFTT